MLGVAAARCLNPSLARGVDHVVQGVQRPSAYSVWAVSLTAAGWRLMRRAGMSCYRPSKQVMSLAAMAARRFLMS